MAYRQREKYVKKKKTVREKIMKKKKYLKKKEKRKTCLFYINPFLHWNSKEQHGNAMSYMWWQREFAYVYTRREKERVIEREMMIWRKKREEEIIII
jgi:hypothetical protein